MSEPFIAEIKIFGFNFAPRGWAACDGQILPINQNQSLYSLLGTTYGGDGRTTFALPDLRGRIPIHKGQGFNLGSKSGSETVALSAGQIPAHTHSLRGLDKEAEQTNPDQDSLPAKAEHRLYNAGGRSVNMGNGIIGNNTGGQPHNNVQPFLVLNYCILLTGIFPPRS